MAGKRKDTDKPSIANDPRLEKWLFDNVSKKDRFRYGMAYTPKAVTQFMARSTLSQARKNGLIERLNDGREYLPVLEPFAGIGIMVEDMSEVFVEQGVLPCVVAYELNGLAAKECQRRNPHAYVVNTDTFQTPTNVMEMWESAFVAHFILSHNHPDWDLPRPRFKGHFHPETEHQQGDPIIE